MGQIRRTSVAPLMLLAGGCFHDALTDANGPVRDIGSSADIAAWAGRQSDAGQMSRGLRVLARRAGDATDRAAFDDALVNYLDVMRRVEQHPPDDLVPWTGMGSAPAPIPWRQVVDLNYGYAMITGREGRPRTFDFFAAIEPPRDPPVWHLIWVANRDRDLPASTRPVRTGRSTAPAM